MSDKNKRQKVKAFNMDLDAIGIKVNVEPEELGLITKRGFRKFRPTLLFTIDQMYELWESMDRRIVRG